MVADEEAAAGWRSETIHTPGSAAALFGEQPLPIAGDGTPLVAEFAVIELAGLLEQSHEATLALLGDVLDLAHRLPRLWALVRSLEVPVRLGREAARVSRDLDLAAAGHADRLLAWQPRRLNPHRIGVLVHEARLYADPDRAIADHDEALATHRWPGQRHVPAQAGPPVHDPLFWSGLWPNAHGDRGDVITRGRGVREPAPVDPPRRRRGRGCYAPDTTRMSRSAPPSRARSASW